MTALFGAWSLSGRNFSELRTGDDKLARQGQRLRAYEGWLPGSLNHGSWLETPPPGHYVLAEADLAAGTLRLWRDPTAGERLYYAVAGDLLLFASSIRPLLAHSALGARLDEEVALEKALAEITHFGDRTLLSGVRELLPGHRLDVVEGKLSTRWAWGDLLRGLSGPEPDLAKELRSRLSRSVRDCIEGRKEIAVALSGGIDSAAVAALAAEEVGAANVHAFTYAFDDPAHPGEAAQAAEICRHLGIRRHRVLKLTYEQCKAAVPQAVWHSEEPTCWARPHTLLLARAIAAEGHDRFLTGFGVGSHMSYFEDVAEVLRWLPAGWLLRLWKAQRFSGWKARRSLLHPGLTSPDFPLPTPLYYLIATALAARGKISGIGAYYPRPLARAAERLAESPRLREALGEGAALPIQEQLRRQAFFSLDSCVDLHRLQKMARENGALWLSPAHSPACLPLTFFPSLPRPALRDPRRRMRPGKRLLQLALRGTLPDSVLDRPKVWRQATAPDLWLEQISRDMAAAAEPSLKLFDGLYGWDRAQWLKLCRNGLVPLAFWHRLFFSEGALETPSWKRLERCVPAQAR